MTFSTTLLKMPRILALNRVDDLPNSYVCCWRRHFLLIKSANDKQADVFVPALQNLQWVESCLHRSAIRAVRLDMNLGESVIKRWANVCADTEKRAYLHLPTARFLPKSRAPFAWRLKRMADWGLSALLLAIMSPLMLLVMLLVYLDSPGPIFFRQWRVGQRGHLFKILKFRTMRLDAEPLHYQLTNAQSRMHQSRTHQLENDPRVTKVGRWLRKYHLDELPQLLNVLRGEMSLVGPRPLALYDALRLSPRVSRRLNALPGMTGFWQVQTRSPQRDLESVSKIDLDYLDNWSLLADFKIVLMTLPKMFGGFGAF